MAKKTVRIKRIVKTFDRCVMPCYVILYYGVIFYGTVLSYITINGLMNTFIAWLKRSEFCQSIQKEENMIPTPHFHNKNHIKIKINLKSMNMNTMAFPLKWNQSLLYYDTKYDTMILNMILWYIIMADTDVQYVYVHFILT